MQTLSALIRGNIRAIRTDRHEGFARKACNRRTIASRLFFRELPSYAAITGICCNCLCALWVLVVAAYSNYEVSFTSDAENTARCIPGGDWSFNGCP